MRKMELSYGGRVSSNKDKGMVELVDGTRKIRNSLQSIYKEFLKLGRKVKYIEPVGPLVAEALNELIDAEMALKAVVDAGNEWNDARERVIESSMRDDDIYDGARFFDPRQRWEGTIVKRKYHQTWVWMMLFDNGEIEELTNGDVRRIRKI